MDKSSIITVLGTAALGLIRSKMGSGLRLKMQYYTWFEQTYDVEPEDAEATIDLIKSFEPVMNQKGFILTSLRKYDGVDGYGNDIVQIWVDIRKVLTSDQDIQECEEWFRRDAYGGDNYDTWGRVKVNQQLLRFIDNVLSDKILNNFKVWDIGTDFNFGYGKVPVNADTGEVYKPATKKESKLRKR